MVFAFVIQTLDREEPELAYYRFYSAWTNDGISLKPICSHSASEPILQNRAWLYDSSIEKKDLLYSTIKKIHMLYSLKLKQSLIPIQNQDRKTVIKGSYVERNWKTEEFCVVWQGVPGIGFSLLCSRRENLVHAQNVLDLIVFQMEKSLQLLSFPSISTKTVDSVALIGDYFLPGGRMIFLNSSILKGIEKQLESELQL